MSNFEYDMLKLQLEIAQAQAAACNGQSLEMQFEKSYNGLLLPKKVHPVPQYKPSSPFRTSHVGVDWADEQKSFRAEYLYQQQVHQELMGEFVPSHAPVKPIKPIKPKSRVPDTYVLKGYVVWQTVDAQFVLAPSNATPPLGCRRVYNRDSCPGLVLTAMATPLSSAAPGKTWAPASGFSSEPAT